MPAISDRGNPFRFQHFAETERGLLFRSRPGETRLGDAISWLQGSGDLQRTQAHYILVFVAEDWGPRANLGQAGAATAWEPAARALLAMQNSRHLPGNHMAIWGLAQADPLPHATPDELRLRVAQWDGFLAGVLAPLFQAGKIPIVIGGGHNNCLPLLQAASTGLQSGMGAINLDAHTDWRMDAGRHSGNGFRKAAEQGYLQRYAALGLAENYTPEAIWADLEQRPEVLTLTWEDLYLRNACTAGEALFRCFEHQQGLPFGLELDTDVISGMPASAATLTGIPAEEIRRWVHYLAGLPGCAYLHLTEAAPKLGPWPETTTGKLLATLATDFIKAHHGSRAAHH
jgi:formiminoglutamase